ncbi:phage integrase SAM-like domain-containing protein [Flavobacterium sp. D11R37]|uniref:tyrosine-type recombinase/integrase n=1 Tax=Flavobacterium coralii TaxID=2838017 RepID=UPI001CA6FEFF|nr:tyrosine-type recombinase/integrase [Flavobacterium coralii]MBY8963860.1 phage integrase SAM-like domain-containing protein [Flavobacterium coralii]
MKKPKINYVLEAKSKDISKRTLPELITARISAGWFEYVNEKKEYQTFKVSLQCDIKPSNFGIADNNFKFDEKIFNHYSKSNAGIKNAMKRLEAHIDKVYSNYILHDEHPTKDEFKKELFIQLGKSKRDVRQKVELYKYLSKKIELYESLKGSGQRNEISEGRIKTFRTLLYYVDRYQKYFNNIIFFENLDEKLYREFWEFQDDVFCGKIVVPSIEGKRKQVTNQYGFSVNGIIKYQKVLVYICKQAVKDKIEVALDVTDTNLILKEKPTAKDIYIDESNLKKIIQFEPSTPAIKNARDYVILASLTGMRYESMVEAHKEEIQQYKDEFREYKYIHSDQNKTDTECIIPLLPLVEKVLETNKDSFPTFPDNATLNGNIKALFKMAKINAKATLTNYTFRNGIIKETKAVSDIVSSHDMRKAFYTNLSNYGLPQATIEHVTHPNKTSTAMSGYYDKRSLINKASLFYDEVKRVVQDKSELYSYQ